MGCLRPWRKAPLKGNLILPHSVTKGRPQINSDFRVWSYRKFDGYVPHLLISSVVETQKSLLQVPRFANWHKPLFEDFGWKCRRQQMQKLILKNVVELLKVLEVQRRPLIRTPLSLKYLICFYTVKFWPSNNCGTFNIMIHWFQINEYWQHNTFSFKCLIYCSTIKFWRLCNWETPR